MPSRDIEGDRGERMKKIMMADDCCLFCGRHSEVAGGHLFIGKYNKAKGWYESESGWIAIEHIGTCAVQICPDCCRKPIKKEG